MGCSNSKAGGAVATRSTTLKARQRAELISSYEEACRLVEELRYLDTALGPPFVLTDEAFSLRSASPSATSPLKLKDVILERPDLFSLMNGYLDDVFVAVLRFLLAIKQCIGKARTRLLAKANAAIGCFEKEESARRRRRRRRTATNRNKYPLTAAMLKELTAAGDPFVDLRTEEVQSAGEQSRSLMAALRERKHELTGSLGRSKTWKKVCKILSTITFVALLAGTVFLAAFHLPPAATTAVMVSSTAVKSLEAFFDSLWDRRKGMLEHEKEIIVEMRKAGFVVHELEGVRLLVEKLKIDIWSLLESAAFALMMVEEVAAVVKIGMEDIRNKIGEIMVGIDGLEEKVICFGEEVRKVAAEFLKFVMS